MQDDINYIYNEQQKIYNNDNTDNKIKNKRRNKIKSKLENINIIKYMTDKSKWQNMPNSILYWYAK